MRVAAEWSLGSIALMSPIFLSQTSSLLDIAVPTFLPRLLLALIHLALANGGASDRTKTRAASLCFSIGPITEASLVYKARIVHGVESSMYNKARRQP